MNFVLNDLPAREKKPREYGLTMVMDKGLSPREAEDFLCVAGDHTDVVKLGWNTSLVTSNLEAKLKVYRDANMPYYFGGTMFEAFVIRKQFDDYRKLLDKYKVPFVEVSNGSIEMEEEDKLNYIAELSKNFVVLSEVGSKDSSMDIPAYKWVSWMNSELEAGAWKVIAEARESGTVGVFSNSGSARSGLIDEIINYVPIENVIWEAPLKSQQVWFIQKMGANVNLGNIAPAEVIPVETLRLGLRGDTFHTFLKG